MSGIVGDYCLLLVELHLDPKHALSFFQDPLHSGRTGVAAHTANGEFDRPLVNGCTCVLRIRGSLWSWSAFTGNRTEEQSHGKNAHGDPATAC